MSAQYDEMSREELVENLSKLQAAVGVASTVLRQVAGTLLLMFAVASAAVGEGTQGFFSLCR